MLEEGNAGGMLGGCWEEGGKGIPEASLFPPIAGECGQPTGGPPGPGFPDSTPRQGLQAPTSSPARSGRPFLLNPPGQRGSEGPSAGPLARQRPQASLASSTDGTVPAPTTASPCPAPAQHPSPPANTPQDKAPNQCSFLAPSTSPRPCHPGCALSTFILLAPSSPPRLGVPSGPGHGEGYGPG